MGLFYLLCLLCIMSSLSATASSLTKSKVVILGGGIHGASIAYHLSQLADPPHITVLERSRVAAAASGKAGGFLAREWGSGSTVQLHQHSFDLHKELAEKFQLSSFRLLDVLSLDGTARAKRPAGGNAASWLDRQVKSSSLSGAAAQVTPLELTERLMLESRAEVVIEIAQGLERNAAGELVGVKTASGRVLEADKVCVSMGPWSGVWVEDYLDVRFPMEGVKSTSVRVSLCIFFTLEVLSAKSVDSGHLVIDLYISDSPTAMLHFLDTLTNSLLFNSFRWCLRAWMPSRKSRSPASPTKTPAITLTWSCTRGLTGTFTCAAAAGAITSLATGLGREATATTPKTWLKMWREWRRRRRP